MEGDFSRPVERIISARKGASVGARIGSVVPVAGTIVGGALGAISGFILGDSKTTFPVDMVAIPAYQAYLLSSTPAFQIFIRAGETLVPTGGNVDDYEQGLEEAATLETHSKGSSTPRKKSAYTKAYEKAFKALKPKYTLKSGKWKKNGFRSCVKAAHAKARKK